MQNKLLKITPYLSIILLSGCASYGELSPQNNPKNIIYKDGFAHTVLKKTNIVDLTPMKSNVESQEREEFIISVHNKSHHILTLSNENIRATSGKEDLKIFTSDELISEERESEMWSALASGMQNISSSMNTISNSNSLNYGTFSGYSQNGYIAGTYTQNNYNLEKQQEALNKANQKMKNDIDNMTSNGRSLISFYKEHVLRKETIAPNDYTTKIIYIKMPDFDQSSTPILISVSLDNEKYNFSFKIEKKD